MVFDTTKGWKRGDLLDWVLSCIIEFIPVASEAIITKQRRRSLSRFCTCRLVLQTRLDERSKLQSHSTTFAALSFGLFLFLTIQLLVSHFYSLSLFFCSSLLPLVDSILVSLFFL